MADARGEATDIHRLLERFGVKVEKKMVADTFLIEHTIPVWVVGRDGRRGRWARGGGELVRPGAPCLNDLDRLRRLLNHVGSGGARSHPRDVLTLGGHDPWYVHDEHELAIATTLRWYLRWS